MKNFTNKFALLKKDEKGVSMLEFALLLPIFLLLMLGSIEVSRLVLFHQKVDNATARVADLITRMDQDVVPCGSATKPGTLQWMYDVALKQSLEPYDLVENETTLVVTSVRADFKNPSVQGQNQQMAQDVEWQFKAGSKSSAFGGKGTSVLSISKWPAGFKRFSKDGGMFNGDRIIAVEVKHTFRPLLNITADILPSVKEQEVYKRAFYRARFGNMGALQAGC